MDNDLYSIPFNTISYLDIFFDENYYPLVNIPLDPYLNGAHTGSISFNEDLEHRSDFLREPAEIITKLSLNIIPQALKISESTSDCIVTNYNDDLELIFFMNKLNADVDILDSLKNDFIRFLSRCSEEDKPSKTGQDVYAFWQRSYGGQPGSWQYKAAIEAISYSTKEMIKYNSCYLCDNFMKSFYSSSESLKMAREYLPHAKTFRLISIELEKSWSSEVSNQVINRLSEYGLFDWYANIKYRNCKNIDSYDQEYFPINLKVIKEICESIFPTSSYNDYIIHLRTYLKELLYNSMISALEIDKKDLEYNFINWFSLLKKESINEEESERGLLFKEFWEQVAGTFDIEKGDIGAADYIKEKYQEYLLTGKVEVSSFGLKMHKGGFLLDQFKKDHPNLNEVIKLLVDATGEAVGVLVDSTTYVLNPLKPVWEIYRNSVNSLVPDTINKWMVNKEKEAKEGLKNWEKGLTSKQKVVLDTSIEGVKFAGDVTLVGGGVKLAGTAGKLIIEDALKAATKADKPDIKTHAGSKAYQHVDNHHDVNYNEITGTFKPEYWTKEIEFNGNKVYQRNDLIDPNVVRMDGKGTNLEAMKRGLAPIGPDGKPINLHHLIQTEAGGISEVTQTFHQIYKKALHINPSSIESGINRGNFKVWREEYWRNRAKDFESSGK